MAELVGKDFDVKITSDSVVGMGTWTMNVPNNERVDNTSFGDDALTFKETRKQPTAISFDGYLDLADTTGARALRLAQAENTALTTLRLFVDNTSYYAPNQTAGYFDPTSTTGANTIVSNVKILTVAITGDRGDIGKLSFTAECYGDMVLI